MIKNKKGFTLIEVIFAIVILSSSLVVLLGLQNSSISRSVRDKNQQQAMLLARSILSAIDASPEDLDYGEVSKPAYELLRDFNGINDDDEVSDSEGAHNSIQADLNVEEFEIPLPGDFEPILMQKIILTLSWSEVPEDRLVTVYYLPIQDERQ